MLNAGLLGQGSWPPRNLQCVKKQRGKQIMSYSKMEEKAE